MPRFSQFFDADPTQMENRSLADQLKNLSLRDSIQNFDLDAGRSRQKARLGIENTRSLIDERRLSSLRADVGLGLSRDRNLLAENRLNLRRKIFEGSKRAMERGDAIKALKIGLSEVNSAMSDIRGRLEEIQKEKARMRQKVVETTVERKDDFMLDPKTGQEIRLPGLGEKTGSKTVTTRYDPLSTIQGNNPLYEELQSLIDEEQGLQDDFIAFDQMQREMKRRFDEQHNFGERKPIFPDAPRERPPGFSSDFMYADPGN